MEMLQYKQVDGTPDKDGIYFVDDEELGELNVIHLRNCPIQGLVGRILGYEDDLGVDILGTMTFYGPVPLPSNAQYVLLGE